MKAMVLITFFWCMAFYANCQIDSEVLFKSFRQGQRANCASIALIKASLEVYGLNNLFFIINEKNETTKYILKDSSIVLLSKEELALADSSAGFEIIEESQDSRAILKYAKLTYAIMAKHKQNIENYKTFVEALEDLEYGANAEDVYKYLGFKKRKQVIKLKRFSGGNLCGLIAWSPAHAVYACDGYMDYHGRKATLWAKYSGRIQIVK